MAAGCSSPAAGFKASPGPLAACARSAAYLVQAQAAISHSFAAHSRSAFDSASGRVAPVAESIFSAARERAAGVAEGCHDFAARVAHCFRASILAAREVAES